MEDFMNNLTFTMEERGKPDAKGSRAIVLIDSEGFICGIYASKRLAEAAIPKIKRNVSKGRVTL